jgi:hypothetical protein
VKNSVKNRIVLNQSEAIFNTFKRKEFNDFAYNRYLEFVSAYKKKDKVDLINILSIPLYDVNNNINIKAIKSSLKDKRDLPF